jgi:hypothetical protein
MPDLTIDWIEEQRARAQLAAMVDADTFTMLLDNYEASMQREAIIEGQRQGAVLVIQQLEKDVSNLRHDIEREVAKNTDLLAENARLRMELQSASNQLELLAYTSAGNDHGLSRFCAGLAGHIKLVLNQNEVSVDDPAAPGSGKASAT